MSALPVYKHLDLYKMAKKLVYTSYELTHDFPEDERNISGQKFRTIVLSAYVYIIQGLSRKNRKKFFKKAQLQLVVLDGFLEIYKELNLIDAEKLNDTAYLLVRCLELLKKPETESPM